MSEPATSSLAWSAYWSNTHQGAIDVDSTDPVARALAAHWATQVDWISGAKHIVDVGSGPAVLLRLLHRLRPGCVANSHWICIDAAAVDQPKDLPPSSRVEFRSGIDFAYAAPPTQRPDALVSNFGLEYVDRPSAAAACARWLHAGARMSCVLHAKGSVIDRTAGEALIDIPYALDELGLYHKAAALLTAMSSAPADSDARRQHAVPIRMAYNVAVDALKSAMEQQGRRSPTWIDMLNHVTSLAKGLSAATLGQALQSLADRASALENEAARLAAMRHCALDADEIETFTESLRWAGFSPVDSAPLNSSVGLVGWTLSAQRS